MKIPSLLLCVLFSIQALQGAPLSDADRESLLENLEQLQAESESSSNSKVGIALTAFRNALASDQAAIELYLNCLEKVNFVDQDKSGVDFAKWKRNEGEKLSEPGLKLALRHQLRWLILTLQASSEKADRDQLAAEAQEIVDSIFRDPDKLEGQDAILGQSVISSIFATAYGINHVKVEKWPLSPIELGSIYDDLLLPQWRNSEQLEKLRATWIKRILQEGAKVEFFSKRQPRNRDQRGEARDDNHAREIERFTSQTQPKLQWSMELELFEYGDEKGAAVRMFTHLQKFASHPEAKEWADQLKQLLTPVAPKAPVEPEETSP